ncbi:MAG: hypothetical protein GY750_03650 [Lentisphaerae bacterium]|nr:hypothetical protein [Lentisphaerota bacterium]MCP4100511.1 hypothetical protein [Lentisphaerota bacterium]
MILAEALSAIAKPASQPDKSMAAEYSKANSFHLYFYGGNIDLMLTRCKKVIVKKINIETVVNVQSLHKRQAYCF